MSGRFDRTNFVSGIETFFNFVTFILRNNFEDKSFSNEVISEVCTYFYSKMFLNMNYTYYNFQQVLTLVKFSLGGKLAKTMAPPVISHLAIFLEFLTNNNTFHSLKTTIWNYLNTLLIENGLDEEIIFDNILTQLQVHLIVLNHLRSPDIKKKKNFRVKFEETVEVLSPEKPIFNDDYRTDLENFVIVILKFYLDKTSNSEIGHMYSNHVCQVILAFKEYQVDKKLSQTLHILKDHDDTSSSFKLYNSYFKTWINNDNVLTYNSISVIVGLLNSIDNEEERLIIIEDLNLVMIFIV